MKKSFFLLCFLASVMKISAQFTVVAQNATCSGGCNGAVSFTAGGGVPPYTVVASGSCTFPAIPAFNSTITVSNVCPCASPYNFILLDNNSNVIASSNAAVSVPPPPTAIISTKSVTCSGACSGGATVTAQGSGPFSYTWNPSVSTGSTATGLCAGIYTVTVSNAGNCSTFFSFLISQPPALTASIASSNAGCPGYCNGSATVTVSGGTAPYTYSWNPAAGTSSVVSGLCFGAYGCTVSDAGACTAIATTTVFSNPAPVVTLANPTVNICSGSTAFPMAFGASNYTWSTGANTNSIAVSPTVTSTYSVIGSNSFSCTDTAFQYVNVNPVPNLTVTSSSPTVCLGTSTSLFVSGATTYTWNTLATTPSINVIPNTSTVYSVSGTNTLNCAASETIAIAVNGSCSDVWPGDANSDGIANSLDILELGLHYTQTGTARATTANNWASFYCNNWTGTVSTGKNKCHSDCNGDGIIDMQDTLAVYNNFGMVHSFKISETQVNEDITITADQGSIPKGAWGTSSIFLGSTVTPVSNVYGVAFDVLYDTSLIETDSVYIEYIASFLNSGTTNILFRKRVFSNSVIYAASVRTDLNNVAGNGKIATLHYKAKGSLTNNAILDITLSNAKIINTVGSLASLSTGSTSVNILAGTVGIEEFNSAPPAFYPNPVSDKLYFSGSGHYSIEIRDVKGMLIKKEELTGNSMNISDIPEGIYFLFSGKTTCSKLVILRNN